MRNLLDLSSMETRHKVEQVKAYLNAMQNPKNPLHDAVREEKGCRLARRTSWMGQAEQSVQHVCGLAHVYVYVSFLCGLVCTCIHESDAELICM